ncbi:MAG: flagellar biosynthetic protein FliR [Clostridia bacterium]|nr:flagellar biosynthetic protein FliR [Clostridia bacterium]
MAITLESVELVLVLMLRLMGFFVTAPFFNGRYINTYVKGALSFCFAVMVFYSNETLSVGVSMFDNSLAFGGICVTEALIGAMIGFVTTIIYNAIIFAGTLIDSQAGLTMATVYDPSNSMQLAITANLYYYALIAIFLVTNMHHTFIKAIFFSYDILPIGKFAFTGSTVSYIIKLMGDMFLLAFKFASPIIATMLILDVGLGVLVRAVPQMNVFVVGFPLKIAMFLLIMIFATDLIIDNYAIIYDKSTDIISNFLKLFAIETG